MNPGDVHWVEFPAGAGRAQAGRRPAIIVQTKETSQQVPTVLVVPLTTNLDALRFPGTLLAEPDKKNGLRARSVALIFPVDGDRSELPRQATWENLEADAGWSLAVL